MPVPEIAKLSGVLVADVATLSRADRLATASGLNVTLIVHDAPAARLAGQLFVWPNHAADAPVTLILLTENDSAPLFVSVTV